MPRRLNFQTVSWFYDLFTRGLLDLDPPYQRRSVWNQSFKDYFVETVLLVYPSPAIFLYEDIVEDGRSFYHVVDGKQRLTTLFEFVTDKFPVSDKSAMTLHQGKYFGALGPEIKKNVWGYQFLVEYIATNDEGIIDGMFDRLNRNVAKLSPQELRHAKFDGAFIKACEELSEVAANELPPNFPRIAAQSKRQMKDVEVVSLLLLLIEEGPRGYSQADLDKAFSDRDDEWEARVSVEAKFREIVNYLRDVTRIPGSDVILNSRLRNQTDFYSLVGAMDALRDGQTLPPPNVTVQRLTEFAEKIEDEAHRAAEPRLKDYYEAARSASNDRTPRETRIRILTDIIRGN